MRVPSAALYGRGAFGAEKARDETWALEKNNDKEEGFVRGTMGSLAGQAASAEQRKLSQDSLQRDRAYDSRNQDDANEQARRLAAGDWNSSAQQQLRSGVNQAMAQQRALAGSARGGAAIATAGANMAANNAAIGQSGAMQAGLLRSQEMATGRGLLNSGLKSSRDMGLENMDMSNRFNQNNAAMNDKFAMDLGGAGVGLGNASAGQDKSNAAYVKLGMAPIDAQSEANQARREWLVDREKARVANSKV
jgi:hypothetical protein